MTQVLITESYLEDIADAIREKSGSESTYTPAQMATAIENIPSAGEPDLVTKAIVANGTYAAEDEGHDGYSQVAVQVPNSYAASDEGKVVSNGALVAQTGTSISVNGTYDTTLNDEVVVNVSGGGSATLVSKTITQNGTYNPADDNADGYSNVTVNVPGGGGGSDAFMNFDFTKASGTIKGVTYGSTGAVFDSGADYMVIPFGKSDMTVEIDVAQMQLTSGSHRRFVMGTASNGLIYRSSGVWAFYAGSWQETTETDGSFFDNCTVRIYVDSTDHWHIYKDGVLFFEPTSPLALDSGSGLNDYLWFIGSSSEGINNAVISAVRLYDGEYTG